MIRRTGCSNRIVYLVGCIANGGIERQLEYMLTHMDLRQYRPLVIGYTHTPDSPWIQHYHDLGVDVRLVQSGRGRAGKLLHLREILKQASPEIMQSLSFYTNFPLWLASRGLPGICVGSSRSFWPADMRMNGRLLGTLNVRFPGVILANSRITADGLQSIRRPFRPRRVEFTPNAIHLKEAAVSQPWPEPEKPFTIVSVGRMEIPKNWPLALRAVKRFGELYGRPWRFVVCGSGTLFDRVVALASKLGLQNNIQFTGFTQDLTPYVAGSHVFLLTSFYEGTPNALLEAMLAGRPAVAAAVGDVPRLITHGVNGWLVEDRNPETYTRHLLRLAAHPIVARDMGRLARQRVEQEPGPADLVKQQFEIYRSLGWSG